MIRTWHNQKEIPTPQTEGWEKTKMTPIPIKHIITRVMSYSPIDGHTVTRTELKYENVHKAQTAQKSTPKQKNN